MNIPVLIIEDNKAASEALVSLLSEYQELKIVDTVSTLSDASEAVNTYHPALLFIDVELPDGNGIEFYEALHDKFTWNVYAVFYTAYDKYAIDALRAQAHDYLLKPVKKSDVQEVLHRFFIHCADRFANSGTASPQVQKACITSTFLVVDNKNNKIAIKPSDVGFFHYLTDRKVWEVHCNDESTYILRHGINSSRLLQTSQYFEQVHKSYIVNVNVIVSMDENNLILMPPFDSLGSIPISRSYRTTLCNRFCQL